MTILAQYLLKLSISLAFVYLFYALVLRKLTFYSWNRWYLLGYSLLAFLIPFVNVENMLQKNEWTGNKVIELIPAVDNYNLVRVPIASTPAMNYWFLVFLLFVAGIAVLGGRLLMQYISYRRLRNAATLLSSGEVMVYQVNKPIIPFSFGNSVFINQHQHTDVELEKIIRHEFIHVKQKHTVDILWGELLCILNWYNPFAWLIRKSIRQNLEFIADNRVISEGADKRQYQYLLLKVIGTRGFSLSQQFNFSSLKKRIAMMNKVRSAKLHLVKFLFILPLIAVLLVSFRGKIEKLLTAKTYPVLLQQSPGINIEADVQAVLHNKTASKSIKHLTYINDTTPSPKAGAVSHPPEDGGEYIIDASQNKISINAQGKSIPLIRSIPTITSQDEPLIVVDGVMQDLGMKALSAMNPNDIQSISVYKGETAMGMYGEKAKFGVIFILTKSGAKKFKNDSDTGRVGKKADNLLQALDKFKGIIIVDDIDFSVEEFKNMHLLADSIEAVFIYNGETAQQMWGKKAANGVIKIETKAYRAHHVTSVDQYGKPYHEYTSAERDAIEQEAQKNNILYIGIENKIALPDDPKKIEIKTDDEIILHSDSGYFINPKHPGEMSIKIFKVRPDGSKNLLENRKYTVKYYPPPHTM